MPKINIKGIGSVEVTKKLGRIPKTMKDSLTGERVKVDREVYKVLWATRYGTPEARRKLARKYGKLKEVV